MHFFNSNGGKCTEQKNLYSEHVKSVRKTKIVISMKNYILLFQLILPYIDKAKCAQCETTKEKKHFTISTGCNDTFDKIVRNIETCREYETNRPFDFRNCRIE